jgi:HPt (histidine-containing phosphotransfer) domain-containing protein
VVDFLRDTPPLLVQISQALAAHDWKVLKNGAHSLRSSSGHMGALKLANLLGELESACSLPEGPAEPDISRMQKQLDLIEEEYHKVFNELSVLREEFAGG